MPIRVAVFRSDDLDESDEALIHNSNIGRQVSIEVKKNACNIIRISEENKIFTEAMTPSGLLSAIEWVSENNEEN